MPKTTVWYRTWENFLNYLESRPRPSNYDIMVYVHKMIDDCRGFRYNRIATSSSNYLALLIKRHAERQNEKSKAKGNDRRRR